MKRFWIIAFTIGMMFVFAACGESKGTSGGPTDTKAARVENGRLSAIEPPTGWLLGEAQSEDQLIYLWKHDLYDQYPQDAPMLSIDINEDDTPEEKLKAVKDLSDRWEEAYEVGAVTIGSTRFHTFSSRSAGLVLIGARDGMTLSINVDNALQVDDPAVVAIINSIRVAKD
ncbi:hypothetical protein LJC20_00060 [Eubacteriales bacterium OttesenSCG-928-M02]|nr:hypothetical protein [Eubacteriales bacterium OttesenSCG-928-M02]